MISSEDNDEDEFYVDPELEKIRDEGLTNEQVNYEKIAKDLCEEMEGIHSAYLFHPKGTDARKKICICISSTPADSYHSSWKDLAGELGLSFGQICCINNSDKDYTEVVLMVFCQKSGAALSLLVNAFLNIRRLDALSVASDTFPVLAEFVKKDYLKRMEKSGYRPASVQGDGKKKLIIPQGFRQIRNLLPITLQEDMNQSNDQPQKKQPQEEVKKETDLEKNIRRIEVMQIVKATPIEISPQKRSPRFGKRVMLTFASDCLEYAQTIAQEFRTKRKGYLPFKVTRLDENEENVNLDPMNFIAHEFEKVDYIIPILSERYFEALCNGRDLCSMDYLDENYIKVLFNHMNMYYMDNHCMNDKIRCIIPKRFVSVVLNHRHFKMYPIFKVYTSDDPEMIESLIIRLAKRPRKQTHM